MPSKSKKSRTTKPSRLMATWLATNKPTAKKIQNSNGKLKPRRNNFTRHDNTGSLSVLHYFEKKTAVSMVKHELVLGDNRINTAASKKRKLPLLSQFCGVDYDIVRTSEHTDPRLRRLLTLEQENQDPPSRSIEISNSLAAEEMPYNQRATADTTDVDVEKLFGKPKIVEYSLKDYIQLVDSVENDMNATTEYIEECKGIRGANQNIHAADSLAQSKAQYGRLKLKATEHLFDILELNSTTDVFLDIGHGIGNTVLQAAYVRQCSARGIELVQDRNAVAISFMLSLRDQHRVHLKRDYLDYRIGDIKLVCGRLEASEHRAFLTEAPPGRHYIKAFINNYNSVMGDLCAKPRDTYYLDHYNAGLFALMPAGSIMVTLHPLDFVPSRSQIQKQRRNAGLVDWDSDDASFYEMEVVELGEAKEAVTWASGSSEKVIVVYKYVRVEQTSRAAVFQCWNSDCPKAQAGTSITATKSVTSASKTDVCVVTNTCNCNCRSGSMSTRSRNKTATARK